MPSSRDNHEGRRNRVKAVNDLEQCLAMVAHRVRGLLFLEASQHTTATVVEKSLAQQRVCLGFGSWPGTLVSS